MGKYPIEKKIHRNAIKVECYNPKTGKIVCVYASITECATKLNISKSKLAIVLDTDGLYKGRVYVCGWFSPEKKRRQIAYHNPKRIEQYDEKTGLLVNVFSSITDAAKANGMSINTLSRYLKPTGKSYNGFRWRRRKRDGSY